MDRFAAALIARGPTFLDDQTPTGSVHIVELQDSAAVRAFALDEPSYQAGAYRDVLIRRWHNVLGRTMWDFPNEPTANKFLVLGLGTGPLDDQVPAEQGSLVAYGPLLSDDANTWVGTAALVKATDAAVARAVLDAGRYETIEVHNWEFGGRR